MAHDSAVLPCFSQAAISFLNTATGYTVQYYNTKIVGVAKISLFLRLHTVDKEMHSVEDNLRLSEYEWIFMEDQDFLYHFDANISGVSRWNKYLTKFLITIYILVQMLCFKF